MKVKVIIWINISLFFWVQVHAQKPQATDIYLVRLYKSGGEQCFDKPVRISKFKGYNNQPYFTPYGTLYFVSNVDSGQTDIFQYNLYNHKTSHITRTKSLKEYSPQLMPDKSAISCVRVEADDSTQNLCTYTYRGNALRKYNNMPGQVGYYCWIDEDHVALFILRKAENHELVLYNARTQHVEKTISSKIGRCMQKIPGGTGIFSYVQKSDTGWTLCKYDIKTGQQTTLLNMLPNVQDYAWTPDNKVWCMYEGRLYEASPHGLWHVISDFCSTDIEKGYRLSLSPDMQYLAFVVYYGDIRP